MKQSERLFAFISAMLITFGISGLDMENMEYVNNEREYIVLILGIIALIVFIVLRIRR